MMLGGLCEDAGARISASSTKSIRTMLSDVMSMSFEGMSKAVVFDIQGFSTDDGPGIRTTVFFKGCPLRCLWCHNPEGLSPEPELCVKVARCKNCGKCLAGCNHPDCQQWGRCLHICPSGNISVVGKQYTASELAELLLRDKDIFDSSDGGVTFSGGEPLLQIEFIASLTPKLGGIHTAVETCGYVSERSFSVALDCIDFFLFDLKVYDSGRHKKYTGVENGVICRNLKTLQKSGKPHVIRIPLIPGYTDDEENLRGLAKLAGGSTVPLLTYNALAGAKYANLGKVYPLAGLQPTKTEGHKKYINGTTADR